MSSLFGGSKTETNSTVTTQLPGYIQKGGQDVFDFSKTIASEPYQPYGAARVAPLSGAETSGVNLAKGSTGAGTAFLSDARGNLGKAAGGFPSVDLSKYMNPYIKGALDPAAREIGETAERSRRSLGANAAASSAFGGSRHTLAESELKRGELEAIGDLYGRGYATAFDTASGLANTDLSRMASIAGQQGQMAALESDLADKGVNRLMTAGAAERGVTQQNLNTAYGDFLEQRDWPVRNLDVLMRALGIIPYEKTTVSQNEVPGPSAASQIGGLGLGAAGLYSLLSDEDEKEDRAETDPDAALEGLRSLEIDAWRYKPDAAERIGDAGERHIGVMAQDFKRAFGYGDGRTIPVVDALGVTMNAIKALDRKIDRLAA